MVCVMSPEIQSAYPAFLVTCNDFNWIRKQKELKSSVVVRFTWWEESHCKQQFAVAVTELCPLCHTAGHLWCKYQDSHVHLRYSVAGSFQYFRLSSLEKSFLYWEWLTIVDPSVLLCFADSFGVVTPYGPSDTSCLPLFHHFNNPISKKHPKPNCFPF